MRVVCLLEPKFFLNIRFMWAWPFRSRTDTFKQAKFQKKLVIYEAINTIVTQNHIRGEASNSQ